MGNQFRTGVANRSKERESNRLKLPVPPRLRDAFIRGTILRAEGWSYSYIASILKDEKLVSKPFYQRQASHLLKNFEIQKEVVLEESTSPPDDPVPDPLLAMTHTRTTKKKRVIKRITLRNLLMEEFDVDFELPGQGRRLGWPYLPPVIITKEGGITHVYQHLACGSDVEKNVTLDGIYSECYFSQIAIRRPNYRLQAWVGESGDR